MGLLRYDGQTFKQYLHDREREDSLSGNIIHDIHEDSKKLLWVATDDGLNRYDRKYDPFTRYQYDENDPHGLGGKHILQLLESSSQQLWALTPESLNRYDPENDRFHRFTPPPEKLGSARLTGFVIDLQGRFWILEDGNRIWRFYPDTGDFEASEIFRDQTDSRKKFYRDRSDDLWVADNSPFNPGLFQFFPDTKSLQAFDLATGDAGNNSNWVEALLEYPEGQLLLATRGEGLIIFDKDWTHTDATQRNANYANLDPGS